MYLVIELAISKLSDELWKNICEWHLNVGLHIRLNLWNTNFQMCDYSSSCCMHLMNTSVPQHCCLHNRKAIWPIEVLLCKFTVGDAAYPVETWENLARYTKSEVWIFLFYTFSEAAVRCWWGSLLLLSRQAGAYVLMVVCCYCLTRLVLMCSWQWLASVRCVLSLRRSAFLRCQTTRTLSSCCVRRSMVVRSRSTDIGWNAVRTRTVRLCLRVTLNVT